jgi:hypothetical protein
MAIPEQKRSTAAPDSTAALSAAQEAYDELKRTWALFRLRLTQVLPDIVAGRRWQEWVGDRDILRMRALVGEWVVAGDANPDTQEQGGIEISRLAPHLAQLFPAELRSIYVRGAELSLFLVEQTRIAQGLALPEPAATVHCQCGVAVPPESTCASCGRPICVLHSRLEAPEDTLQRKRVCRACLLTR